jgi:hypothetical protein
MHPRSALLVLAYRTNILVKMPPHASAPPKYTQLTLGPRPSHSPMKNQNPTLVASSHHGPWRQRGRKKTSEQRRPCKGHFSNFFPSESPVQPTQAPLPNPDGTVVHPSPFRYGPLISSPDISSTLSGHHLFNSPRLTDLLAIKELVLLRSRNY